MMLKLQFVFWMPDERRSVLFFSLLLKVSAYRAHSIDDRLTVSIAEIQATIASNSRIRTDLESSPSIENSGLNLVSAPLTGDNYLVWSRAVRFALGAKKKLSFIDGRSVRPADNSEELDEWIRIDCMIITWILNLVSKEIIDAFIYATSTRALWLELEARYGGSNG
ncbi:UNVERIFIED_CONTAM: hypothetical protein Sangu_2807600 [Sesamum angustifolium]|uniref:Retrotransposon Copia-like N-terminal domain-containing protein n=1 Tax=Sesamum angustifolium TaxID=2727405 RepID=A0AAW2ITZ1_9LAMI